MNRNLFYNFIYSSPLYYIINKKCIEGFNMSKYYSIFTTLFIIIICISAYKDGHPGYAIYYSISLPIILIIDLLIRFFKHKKA